MHPQQFVLISKSYSDGVSLQKIGPQLTKEFTSECVLVDGRTFKTGVCFVPKLVAKKFVTTLTVADELTYYECIAFERRTVMKNFTESTNIFIPKDKINHYSSSVIFEPNATERLYTVGTELMPAKKVVVTEVSNHDGEGDATKYCEKQAINGDINGCEQIINGDM